MRRSRSEKKGMMYVHRKLKKRRTGKFPEEKGPGRVAQGMKEQDIVNESEATNSSAPSEGGRTEKSKLVKPMALLCSIQDIDFRDLGTSTTVVSKRICVERWTLSWLTTRTTYEEI